MRTKRNVETKRSKMLYPFHMLLCDGEWVDLCAAGDVCECVCVCRSTRETVPSSRAI